MAGGGRTGEKKSRIRLSKLYSYACMRPTVMENDALLTPMGGPGFSRIVFGNQSHRHRQKPLKYRSNYVSTTKYNLITFLPKALFEQFRRVANMYFLLTACLSLTEIAPVQPASMIAPLVFVVGISMIKEAIEDWRRFQQDREVNSRKVKVHVGNGNFVYNEWKNIRVGDVVKVEKDHFFPADLLMISSNYPDGVCYVETMNLDGETNLKLKKSLEATLELDADEEFRSFVAQINCEDPNPNLYTFVGNLEYEGATLSVGPQQILLRDSKLRNTQYVYGVVIFSGHDTKVMQNSTDPPSKRSRIERKMDHIIYLLFSVLLFISLVGSIVFGIRTASEMPSWWYLQPEEVDISFNPDNAFVSAILHFFSALILYGYLIPISLYVSIEVVKVWQASFINQDLHMYHEESDKPAHARTSNLNEELGQVDTVLSDKTGTLTCNMMEFLKCSIAGISYGVGVTEVEMAVQKRMQDSPHEFHEFLNESNEIHEESGTELLERRHVKGFNFQDDRLMKGQWVHEAKPDVIAMFFRILAVCHTAIPDENEETGAINYEAESPDESAFVVAARELGFEFYKRSQTTVYIKEFDKSLGQQVEREYKILNLLEFNSTRKRMSVVVQDEDGQRFLFCKGADSVIYDRLAKNGREYEEETRKHLASYADAGLRTLALSYRRLDESEYSEWNSVFLRAKTTIGLNRDSELEAASDLIEKDLILVGATAVEDKLQKGVPQCIDRLALAGLKIWVLTGDKMETAINIGFACSLLRQGMQQIVVTLDNANVKATEELGIKENIAKISKESIQQQLTIGMQQITMEMNPDIDFALIIDGKALNYALEEDMKDKFLHLAIKCASVICCRVSPKQKAMVTRLVKEGKGKTTLAIGDGANDVGMIQEADIGVGISGVEGMQAVMASDFSIAQFCYLERLLIVHGHWCYKRIATMICYFFYKNIVFGLTLFYYEAYTSFSGQALYNDWLMTLFNVFFSSLPVISLGVFEQDVSGDTCLEFPALYQQGPQNKFFGWARISSWMGNGVYASAVSFYITAAILKWQAFQEGGQLPELDVLGSAMYTYIVWTVNCQIALTTSHFTWIQHLCIWGSIGLWYIFLYIFGLLSPDYSTTVFQILSEALAPSPIFWLATLLVPLLCILPYFAFTACQRVFFPMDHHIIQEIKHSKKDQDDPEMWSREKAKAVEKASIGFTATVESRLRHLRKKLQSRNFRDRKK